MLIRRTVGLMAIAATLGSVSTQAAHIDLIVEGGGTPIVYELTSGNYLGLWGFDNRGNSSAVTVSESDLLSGFTSGSVVDFFDPTGAEFFDMDFTIAADTRLFDAIWVEWTGGNLVYSYDGRTRTMGTGNAQEGSPFPAEVPEPAPLALLGLGMLAMGVARRKKAQ